MVQLTAEQHVLLMQDGSALLRIHDPASDQEYVLVPAEIFARLETLVATAEDEEVQAAWLMLSRQRAEQWAIENPF